MIQGQFERAKYILTEIKGIDSKLTHIYNLEKSIGGKCIKVANQCYQVYIQDSTMEKTIVLVLKAHLEDSKSALQAEFDAL